MEIAKYLRIESTSFFVEHFAVWTRNQN